MSLTQWLNGAWTTCFLWSSYKLIYITRIKICQSLIHQKINFILLKCFLWKNAFGRIYTQQIWVFLGLSNKINDLAGIDYHKISNEINDLAKDRCFLWVEKFFMMWYSVGYSLESDKAESPLRNSALFFCLWALYGFTCAPCFFTIRCWTKGSRGFDTGFFFLDISISPFMWWDIYT